MSYYDIPEDMVATQRGALVAYWLSMSPRSTTWLARRLGITNQGTRRLLCKIEGVLPLCLDDDGQTWRLMPPAEDWPF